MYICLCHGVTDSKIKRLVEEGASSVQEIQKKCSAGTDCGACVNALRELSKGKGCPFIEE